MLNIQYHSAPPSADTGYGVHTRNLVSRLKEDHDVFIQSVGGWEGMGIDWAGVDIYPSGSGKHGEQSIPYWFDENDADVVFSHHDHWSSAETYSGIQQNGIPMVLYTILDHGIPGPDGDQAPEAVVQANEHAFRTVVMSKWAERRMHNSRVPDSQIRRIPHAFDTKKYAPVTHRISQAELKDDLGIPEDAFLFGMVAANYGPRKNLPSHLEAFKRFRERNDADDAYLYVHTHPTMGGGYNMYEVRKALNLDEDRVLFPDPHKMYHGLDDLTVVQLYNTFDVHLNCSQSESWGMTVTEAMSTETPVIATNNSAMTEQFGVDPDTVVSKDEQFRVTDQGILVHRGNEMWTQNACARRFIPAVEDVVAAMEYYYNNPEEGEKHGQNARDYVVENYDWDVVYENHWQPLFEEVEEELTSEEYDDWYFKRRGAEAEGGAFQTEAQKLTFQCRGDSVLDVGCGTGKLLELLRETGFDVTGVEYAEKGVEICQEKDLNVRQGDIRDLQFKDDSFDTVISQHVLEHIDADVHAMSELCRVAKQRVVCLVPGKDTLGSGVDDTEERRYDEDELDRLTEELADYAGYEAEYTSIEVTENTDHWIITVDLE